MTPSSLRIMIIDDEECIRDSLSLHLVSQGHEVLTYENATLCPAFNGHECHLKGPCADIILVDHNMPDMSGLELLRALTMHGCHVFPKNRFLMTGDAAPDLAQKVQQMSCEIIQKPLSLDKLDEIIEKARIFISADRKLSDISE